MIARHRIGAAALALGMLLSACSNGSDNVMQGWIEGDFIFVSPDEQGRIEQMMVRQGDAVKKDQLLFVLDTELQEADLGVAEATLANAKQAFDRAQQLLKSGSGTQKDFDFTQALYREAQARLAAAQDAADAAARLESGRRTGADRSITGPARPCRPAAPIISLLPPGNVKVRFYVAEPMLARIAIDDPISFSCDGCPAGMTGKISFISQYAEYTPPVIYSQQERHKLVYLIEAMPTDPARLARRAAGRCDGDAQSPLRNNSGRRHDRQSRYRDRRPRADQVLRQQSGGARSLDAGEEGHDLRLSRAERIGQDHDHSHAHRPADARQGRRHLSRLRHPHAGRPDQAACRLHDAEIQPVSGSVGARESGIRRAPAPDERSGRGCA